MLEPMILELTSEGEEDAAGGEQGREAFSDGCMRDIWRARTRPKTSLISLENRHIVRPCQRI